MDLEDTFRLLVSGYYGVEDMDEYPLKVYILKDIENYILDFIKQYPISHFHYLEEARKLESLPLKTKLQDSLLVLHSIKAPLELSLLIRQKLNQLDN